MTTDTESKPCSMPAPLFDRLKNLGSDLSLRVDPSDTDFKEIFAWIRFQIDEQKSEALAEIEDRFQELEAELEDIEAEFLEDQLEDSEETGGDYPPPPHLGDKT